jgi:phospholipid/cholesterol/gamma-HCH transport system substrate-binding protein
MNEQAIRFRFGIFVLASLILLAVMTILFGGFPNYFKRADSYTLVFADAPGVAPGTPVRRSGVRIGEVHSVQLNNETGKVNVGIQVDDKYTLRKADRPMLQQGLIGGDAAISFVPPDNPKNADFSPVPPGSVIEGISPADPARLVQETTDLVKPAKETLDEIRKVFKGIGEMKPLVDETLKDFREIGKMAKTVGPDLQKASESIRLLSDDTRKMIPEFKRTNEEVQRAAKKWGDAGERTDILLKVNEEKITKSIERMEETLKRLNEILGDENQKNLRDTLKNAKNGSKEFEELMKDSRVTVKQLNESLKRADEALADFQKAMKPLGDKGPSVFKNLDEGSADLNKAIKDIREIIRVVAQNDGTIQRLLSDPSLYNNLNDSALMATKILPRLDRALADFETFSDKLARHPELFGIGGVIRPSSGLKESPTQPQPYRIWPMSFRSH